MNKEFPKILQSAVMEILNLKVDKNTTTKTAPPPTTTTTTTTTTATTTTEQLFRIVKLIQFNYELMSS